MIPFFHQKIWFAFQGLPFERIESEDRFPWSQCLVLTNNMMQILKLNNLTTSFKKYINKEEANENKGVTLKEYYKFIDQYINEERIITNLTDRKDQVRDSAMEYFPTNTKSVNLTESYKSLSDISITINTFNDYCWTLFRTKNLPTLNNQSLLHKGFFNLWLIFITYSIKDPKTGEISIPVKMDLLEAKYWCNQVRDIIGLRKQFDDLDVIETVEPIDYLTFYSMIQDVFKTVNTTESSMSNDLQTLAEEALDGVTIKGAVKVDRYIRFCVLKSFELIIYNSKVNETHFRTSYTILPNTEIVTGSNKIQLKSFEMNVTSSLTLEIGDTQAFNKWCMALSDALENAKYEIINPAIKYAILRDENRKTKRTALKMKRLNMEMILEKEREERCNITRVMEQRLQLADKKMDHFKERIQKEVKEKSRLIQLNERIRQESDAHFQTVIHEQQVLYEIQLEKLKEIEREKNCLNNKLQETIEEKSNEESKRSVLEEKHLEAQKLLLEAEQKIESLQDLKKQLEKALEEEKQAKEEEEHVRNATLLLLEEEQKSKEKLEELLKEQKNTMNQEILKRNESAQELENERIRIKEIAEEKERLAKELGETRKKMKSTGKRVKNLDSRVSQMAETVFGNMESRVLGSHRGQGFITEIPVLTKKEKTNLPSVEPKMKEDEINIEDKK